jgi:hypothetical protein
MLALLYLTPEKESLCVSLTHLGLWYTVSVLTNAEAASADWNNRSFNAEENTMNMEPELSLIKEHDEMSRGTTPSVNFINAISEFFDTDPSDLLVELGYYSQDDDVPVLVA